MSTYAKYMDRYKRMRSASNDPRDASAFKSASIVDREAYTKFMEVELDKVASAFMQVKDLPQRVEQLQGQIILNQEKITNLSRIVNLLQDTENEQEKDIRDIKAALRKLGVSSAAAKDREYTKFKTVGNISEETTELVTRIRQLEDRLANYGDSKPSASTNSEYKNFVSQVDDSLQEMESKLIKMISERLPRQPETSNLERQARSRSNSKSPRSTANKKRRNSQDKASTSSDPKQGTDFKMIEKVINKWTEKIEEQVNFIQNSVDEKVSLSDLAKAIEDQQRDRVDDIDKVHKLAENAEKVSSRLAEDVFESMDISNKKLEDFEDQLNHLREWVEDLSKCSSNKINVTTQNSSFNPGLVSKSDLMEFEKKLNYKILESLDETNSIMKKIKTQYKELAKKVKHLENDKPRSNRRDSIKPTISSKLQGNRSQEKIVDIKATSQHPSIKSDRHREKKQKYNSSDRALQSLVTGIDANKHSVEVVRTVAVSKAQYNTRQIDSSKDTKDNEVDQKTLKRFPEIAVAEPSKEFTDFMTFDEHTSSDIFELSDNDTTRNNRSKSGKGRHKRSNSRNQKNSSTESGENKHPNMLPQARSRVEEFESFRKKKVEMVPRNLKSSSRSRSTKGSRNGSRKKVAKASSRASKGSSLRTNLNPKLKDTKVKKADSNKKRTVVKDTRLRQKMKANKERENSSIKLAKLEKMYQELSELESKS